MNLRLLSLASAFALPLAAGCGQTSADGTCQLDGNCEKDGVVGACVDGYCAFEDPDCPNGKWGDGPNAGECVPTDGDAASDDASTETESESTGNEDGGDTLDTGASPDLPPEDTCVEEVTLDGVTFAHLTTLDAEAVVLGAVPQAQLTARVAVVDGSQFRVLEYDTDAGDIAFGFSAQLPAEALVEPGLEAADLFEDDVVDFAVVADGGLQFVRAAGLDDYDVIPLAAGGNSPLVQAALLPGQARNFIVAYDALGTPSVFRDLDTDPAAVDALQDQVDPTDINGFIATSTSVGAIAAEGSTLSAMFRVVFFSNECCDAWQESIELDAQVDRLFPSASPGQVYVQLINGDLLTAELSGMLEVTPIVAPTDLQAVIALALDDEPQPSQALAAVTADGLWLSGPIPAVGDPTTDSTLCLDEPLVELAAARSSDGDVLLVGRTEGGRLEVFLGTPD